MFKGTKVTTLVVSVVKGLIVEDTYKEEIIIKVQR